MEPARVFDAAVVDPEQRGERAETSADALRGGTPLTASVCPSRPRRGKPVPDPKAPSLPTTLVPPMAQPRFCCYGTDCLCVVMEFSVLVLPSAAIGVAGPRLVGRGVAHLLVYAAVAACTPAPRSTSAV